MARRIDNECAYCAEVVEPEKAIIGKDWKIYCSLTCTQAGELISMNEWDRLMRDAIPSRDDIIQDQIV
jgi:hypothetical protein